MVGKIFLVGDPQILRPYAVDHVDFGMGRDRQLFPHMGNGFVRQKDNRHAPSLGVVEGVDREIEHFLDRRGREGDQTTPAMVAPLACMTSSWEEVI